MTDLFTRAWWTAALERAGSQAAEAALGFLTVAGVLMATGIDWLALLGFALGGALASLMFSFASLPEVTGSGRSPGPARLLRIGRTILVTFSGALITWFGDEAINVLAFDWPTALNAIGVTVVIAVLKVLVIQPSEATHRIS